MRVVTRFLTLVLAAIFLVEVWLWEHLEPLVARLVARIPLQRFKRWLALRVAHLSPAMTLIVFLVPVVPLFPLKLVGLWLLAHDYWIGAISVIVMGKLVGVGVTAFVFDVTKPKLLQMAWFRWLYERVLRVRDWAHRLVDPLRMQIKLRLRMLRLRLADKWPAVFARRRKQAGLRRRVRPANS